MVKIDNFYFVVKDINKSVEFYTRLLETNPTNVIENRWADWCNEDNKIYFGIISERATDVKSEIGNNAVLGLYTDNIMKEYKKCKELNAKILYSPEKLPNSDDNYECFAIEDLDGNKIEIAYYDK